MRERDDKEEAAVATEVVRGGAREGELIDLLCRIVPGSPADIKVVVSSPQALFISWLPPVEPNGVITKYNLYTRYCAQLLLLYTHLSHIYGYL